MKVILLEKIKHLGDLGDQVVVKRGYGRNFLMPQKKAVPATPDNVAYFEAKKAEYQAAAAQRLQEDQARAEQLNNLQLRFSVRASDEGKLYGSIGAVELIREIEAQSLVAHKHEIQLPNGPIRSIGDYEVLLLLHHGEVEATVKVSVVPEQTA